MRHFTPGMSRLYPRLRPPLWLCQASTLATSCNAGARGRARCCRWARDHGSEGEGRSGCPPVRGCGRDVQLLQGAELGGSASVQVMCEESIPGARRDPRWPGRDPSEPAAAAALGPATPTVVVPGPRPTADPHEGQTCGSSGSSGQ
jgi:predicted small secreted protein